MPNDQKQDAKHDPMVWTEVWRERPGDYYADSIHVSADGAVKFECGGRVCVRPSARAWVDLAWPPPLDAVDPVLGVVAPGSTRAKDRPYNTLRGSLRGDETDAEFDAAVQAQFPKQDIWTMHSTHDNDVAARNSITGEVVDADDYRWIRARPDPQQEHP